MSMGISFRDWVMQGIGFLVQNSAEGKRNP